MREQLKKTLEMLKAHVQRNLSKIHENEKRVREILQEPLSEQRSALLTEKYKVNKKILEENNDFIKLQLEIIQFMDKHHKVLDDGVSETTTQKTQTPITPESPKLPKTPAPKKTENVVEYTREDILFLTSNGSIEYDETHPLFKDKKFYNELMEHLIESENYEMCEKIKDVDMDDWG